MKYAMEAEREPKKELGFVKSKFSLTEMDVSKGDYNKVEDIM